MPFPNFEGKHAHEAVFSAHDFLEHLHQAGRGPLTLAPPDGAVLLYQRDAVEHLLGADPEPDVSIDLIGSVSIVERAGHRVAVAHGFGIGAPAASAVMECLIAWGIKRVCSVGLAGALQRDSRIGDIVVCTGAIRDEGVSHHYTPSGEDALASGSLTAALMDALGARGLGFRSGRAWTVDALFRETVAEAAHYRDAGVLAVDMEVAALFTVAAVRGIDVAAAFVLSDSLAGEDWGPELRGGATLRALGALVDVAVDCAGRGRDG